MCIEINIYCTYSFPSRSFRSAVLPFITKIPLIKLICSDSNILYEDKELIMIKRNKGNVRNPHHLHPISCARHKSEQMLSGNVISLNNYIDEQ